MSTGDRPEPPDGQRDPKRQRTPGRPTQQRTPDRNAATGKALQISNAFIQSLKLGQADFGVDSALTQVAGANDVWCLENVVTIFDTQTDSVATQNVVLSKEAIDFWEACIENSRTKHICARGSPGVGKSTTFWYLIRTLLRREKRVIYLYRTEDKENFYHVWKRGEDTAVYPESTPLRDIVNQCGSGETYYLCDAGKTQDSCDPGSKVTFAIINASANGKHWGRREFTKNRFPSKSGQLMTFPMMKKKQIFNAWDKFPNPMRFTREDLEERHRKYGSIVRQLFSDTPDDQLLQDQDIDLAKLNGEKVKRILENKAELNDDSSDAPGSQIMCITGEPPAYLASTSLISDLVQEKVATRHMKDLWNEMGKEDPASSRGHLFESCVRSLFCGKRTPNKYRFRNACGKSSSSYTDYGQLKLGDCTDIRRTTNMIEDCKSGEDGIIYYSYNEGEPLVDFMYKFGNEYYAIQVTIGKKHDCAFEKVQRFLNRLDLQKDQELNLVYAVPSGRFKDFTTTPAANPKVPYDVRNQCYILHAEIKPPQLQSQS